MSRQVKRFAAVGAAVVLSSMGLQTTASAAPATQCTGTITGGSYGSIVVPDGEDCVLNNVTVSGQVQARKDSTLNVRNSDIKQVHGLKAEMVRVVDSRIGHHIHIHHGNTNDPGTDIRVRNTRVGGNIHIHHNVGTIEVVDSTVGGHIQIQHNHSHLVIEDNEVGKNLQVMKTTSAGDKDVTGNEVAGQIHCRDNASPFVGGPNVSASRVHGDCFVA